MVCMPVPTRSNRVVFLSDLHVVIVAATVRRVHSNGGAVDNDKLGLLHRRMAVHFCRGARRAA